MNKILITAGAILLLALLGWAGWNYGLRPEEGTVCTQDAKLCPDGSSVGRTGPNCEFAACPEPEEDSEETPAPEGESGISFQGEVLAGEESPLLDFNQADYETALQTDRLVVLYFYANWCPICAAEIRDALYPAFNQLAGDRVVGFRVNYNDSDTDQSERDLAREFGIAYQHSKIFIRNGQRVLKSPEAWSKSRYLSEIEAALAD